jgi:hypothetical protein
MNNKTTKTMKTMKTKYLSYVVTILLLFALSACKKDPSEVSSSNNKTSTNILTFKNMEEYTNALKEVLSFSDKERKDWEQEQGFQSFGVKCDEIYNSINPDNFKTIGEIKTFVSKNSDFLQLVVDTDGEYSVENRIYSNVNRYFSNMDRIFKIGFGIYKVLEDGMVYANEDQIDKLKQINEANYITYLKDPGIHFSNISQLKSTHNSEDDAYDCGVYADSTSYNGKDRTYLKIQIEEFDPAGFSFTHLYCTYLIKPQKKTLGVWFNCTRTISASLKVRIDHIDWGSANGNWLNEQFTYYEPGKLTSKLEDTFLDIQESINFGPVPHYSHFGGYNCWGDTPSTPAATKRCNTFLVN